MIDRRRLLALVGASPLAAALPAGAQSPLPPLEAMLAERSSGKADAPVTVLEFFSLTCGHCAAFHADTYPRVKSELIDTGRVRLVFRDFPLDPAALAAAAVARAMPPERYDAFISTLMRTQSQWARRSYAEDLARVAALAGMPRATYDAVMANEQLQRGILQARLEGEQRFRIEATPSFVFNNRTPAVSGAIAFERFAREAGVGS
ncbi:thioredoxin domain-containing protein [Elioraea rosea]|uniref:thioredoxin domain-containing protein n=1 Tax=Elioraea rosea TaxID=2492390 RepID=UPI001EF5E3E1|nr:thioredoxin domain-containing protein [Elioraea rosea]